MYNAVSKMKLQFASDSKQHTILEESQASVAVYLRPFYSGILRGVRWHLVTDVSGHPIGYNTSVPNYQPITRNIPQKRRPQRTEKLSKGKGFLVHAIKPYRGRTRIGPVILNLRH